MATDLTDLKAKARKVARQWLEHGAEYQSTGPHETPVITDMLVNLIEAALISEREADAAWRAEASELIQAMIDNVAVLDVWRNVAAAFLAKSPQSDSPAKEKPDET